MRPDHQNFDLSGIGHFTKRPGVGRKQENLKGDTGTLLP
jgi:hypothetical protein